MPATKQKKQQKESPAAGLEGRLELPRPDRRFIEVTVVGDTPFLSHGWDPRVIKGIEDDFKGKAKNKKPPKDPHREACGGLYWLDESGNLMWPGDKPEEHRHGFGIRALP